MTTYLKEIYQVGLRRFNFTTKYDLRKGILNRQSARIYQNIS